MRSITDTRCDPIMRIITLDGPKARYERIRLLDEAADYGLTLDPQATAPFTVRWNALRKQAEICIQHTVLAFVNARPNSAN